MAAERGRQRVLPCRWRCLQHPPRVGAIRPAHRDGAGVGVESPRGVRVGRGLDVSPAPAAAHERGHVTVAPRPPRLDTRTRGSIGFWSAIGFVWFTTRLFGSLRTVLAEVFDIEHERGIILGKLFDLRITVVATLLLVIYFVLSIYLALARTRGVALLEAVGLQPDVLSRFEYWSGRSIAFVFVVTAFYAVYRYLPNRRIRVRQALVGALSTGVLFEIARNVYTVITRRFDPGSLYSGTLYAVISIVFWVYYAALVFIIGGEVAQVNELRRQLRLQRETFDERPIAKKALP
ncbi:MAG: YihY/virulence factor BrkB family protein [Gemmatimonadaceae bacterium]